MSENKIYVGNLSYDITEDALQACFEQCGAIAEVNLIKDRMTQRLKGFGFITFEDSGSVQRAIEMNGEDLLGRPMRVSEAKERARTGGSGGRGGRHGGGGYGGGRHGGGGWDDNRGNR